MLLIYPPDQALIFPHCGLFARMPSGVFVWNMEKAAAPWATAFSVDGSIIQSLIFFMCPNLPRHFTS
jgi:hypothetical protein